jgi:hypothetical protein
MVDAMMTRALGLIFVAETILALGSQVSRVALPLTAVLWLHATPWQMGVLSGAVNAASVPGARATRSLR